MKRTLSLPVVFIVALILTCVSAIAQSDAPTALPELVAYWPLTNDTLNVAADTNHGVIAGEARFEDGALVLNGSDSYVNFGSSLSVTGSFSVCLWLNPATNDGIMRVLGKFEVSEANRDYCLFLNCGNRLWAFFSDNGSADAGHAFVKTTLLPACPADEWHHLAVTWDASQGPAGCSLYCDGMSLSTTNAQLSAIHSLHAGQADLTLGAYDVPALRASAKLCEDGSAVEGPTAAVSPSGFIPPPSSLVNPFRGSLCQLLLFQGVLSAAAIADIAALGRSEDLRDCLLADQPALWPTGPVMTTASNGMTLISAPAGSGLSSTNGVILRPRPRPGPPVRSRVIYVDRARGDDRFSGKASLVIGSDGPKRTVRSGLSAARDGNTLVIKQGNYGEDLNVAGRDVTVRFEGNVKLSGRTPAEAMTRVVVTNSIMPGGPTTNVFSR